MEVYRWASKEEGGTGLPELHHDCGHHTHIAALYLKSMGDFLLVGDVLRSVTLLQYKASDGVLEEVARDFNSNWMTAVEVISEEKFLGTDDHGNLFIVRRNSDALTEEERGKLEACGEISFGDQINVLRKGTLTSQPADQESSALSLPSFSSSSVLFGTVAGTIGTIITINDESFRFFSALEHAIKATVSSEGGLSHDDWRAFLNERRGSPQRNIIDGDLVESLLDLNLDRIALESLVRHLNDELREKDNTTVPGTSSSSSSSSAGLVFSPLEVPMFTVEDVKRRVEDMTRMH